jgi:hypothetical protein
LHIEIYGLACNTAGDPNIKQNSAAKDLSRVGAGGTAAAGASSGDEKNG